MSTTCDKTLSTYSNLSILISKWKREDVEKELHISFKGPVTPSFILHKISTAELSEKQEEYVGKVKQYLQCIDLEFVDLFQEPIMAGRGSTQLLKDVLKDTEAEAKKDSDRLVRLKVMDFTRAVRNLIKPCEELRSRTRSTMYTTTFTRFMRDFAELCCLKPECRLNNDKEGQCVWGNFRGKECAVAEPDIRLKKFGLPDEDTTDEEDSPWTVVTVVDVESASDLGPILTTKPQRDADDELPVTKRLKSNKKRSSASSSLESESSSGEEFESSITKNRKNADSESTADLAFIPIYNSHKVLGQHAGELLFDLNQCFKDVTDQMTIRMPGMIINGVKVIFTLLEVQYEHLNKLRKNKPLDQDDKALIYYSSPYGLLNLRDRNIIIDYFMRLNNIVNYGKSDTVNKKEVMSQIRAIKVHRKDSVLTLNQLPF